MFLLLLILGYVGISALIGAVVAGADFYISLHRRAVKGELNGLPRAEIAARIERTKANATEDFFGFMVLWPVFLPVLLVMAVPLFFEEVGSLCAKAYRRVVGSGRIEERYLSLAEAPVMVSED